MSDKAPKFTFLDFQKRFPNNDVCLDEIWKRRYGKMEACPDCACVAKFHRIKKRKVYSCQECGFQISPCAGTIFHKSRTPLMVWFYTIFLFAKSKNGVSAKEIQRQTGVTYKTAFRIGHKIRELMDEGKDIFMTGTIEVDETLVGGRKKGGKRGWGADKQCVFGMAERHKQVRRVTVADRKRKTLFPIIVQHVDEEATVYSDEFKAYITLGREVGHHDTVNHGNYEWTRGDVHTQSIEGHWSAFKRAMRGTYTSISDERMQAYLNEADFRYNHRFENVFDVLMDRVETTLF